MCDHFIGEGVTDARLNMTLEEHEHALRAGGFLSVAEVKRKGSLVLFRAKCDVVPE